ncbi:MAG: low specificity L-threonine aldolase [Candidatus Nanopelagicaceae bacterium]|nr:low specificity L-threonine aldolase [Candidatus Nanopelagicaceae bacterium]
MIDLRSDTVTKPTKEMLEAMVASPVGDDVYGDDPSINALEARVASMFGKEAGLFTPTGSLSNQLSIRLLVKPGEELILDQTAHIARAELGAAAAFSGITTRTFPSINGRLNADTALALAHPDAGPYLVSTKAIAVEDTHNFGGGTVQSLDEIQKLYKGAQEMKLPLHLDGARIWNAHVASGIKFSEYGKYFETMSVCFSKGLGAPIGSMMLSTKEKIAEARIWRKRYGAGMRQIGLLAGAINYALDHNIERLKEDHNRAAVIASACGLSKPDTNIVALDVSEYPFDAVQFAGILKENGILAGALGKNFVRLVTHKDLTDSDIEQTCEVLKRTLVTK